MYKTWKVIKSQFNPRAFYHSFAYLHRIPYFAILLDEIEKILVYFHRSSSSFYILELAIVIHDYYILYSLNHETMSLPT